MANCTSCSAPLPVKATICLYCNYKNDVDLHAIHHNTTSRPDSDRTCPTCELPMHSINLKADGKFFIERCENCMGLFFDTGELEALLDQSVSNTFLIDKKRIETINKELFQRETKRASFYIKCPVCSEMMQRKNFREKSGVITDCCNAHGVWLESGELKKLLEWKKAGGQLLHDKVSQEQSVTAAQRKKQDSRSSSGFSQMKHDSHSYGMDDDIASSVFNLINRFF